MFTAEDLTRLQAAKRETREFGEFLADRFLTMAIIKGGHVPRAVALSVPDPTTTAGHPTLDGEFFHIRESLGGDQYGEDFRYHYMPVSFALGGDEADADLRVLVEELKHLQATLGS